MNCVLSHLKINFQQNRSALMLFLINQSLYFCYFFDKKKNIHHINKYPCVDIFVSETRPKLIVIRQARVIYTEHSDSEILRKYS